MQVAAPAPHMGPGNAPNIGMMLTHCQHTALPLFSLCQSPNSFFFFPISTKTFAFTSPGGNHGKAVKITNFLVHWLSLKKKF